MTKALRIVNKNSVEIQEGDTWRAVARFDDTVLETNWITDDLFVVVTSWEANYRNIYGCAANGKRLWQIASSTPDINYKKEISSHPYGGCSLRDGQLIAYNQDGYEYRVDMLTGTVSRQKFVK